MSGSTTGPAPRIGADTGGTFSDLVDGAGNVAKVLSTPAAPDEAIRTGIGLLSGHGASPRPALLAHGTTVATNAVLEGRLAPVALLTTEGMADVIEIGRQDRPSLYDQRADRPPPFVPRAHRFEVRERVAADGTVLTPLDLASLPPVLDRCDPTAPATDRPFAAVAVCFLHADRYPAHEAAVAATLRERGWTVVASHEISPEYREYERTVTTVANAGLRPLCSDYLGRLADMADVVSVMTSAGGLLDAATAAERPAALLLSGPAGGVRAGAAMAMSCGFPDAITFDMGGTSTDVCLVQDGVPATASTRHVGGYPVRFPSLDIHTVGAGGGSIAVIDSGGALTVGPASAGADPGPAAYGRCGLDATVTDANLVAGRIPPDVTFGDIAVDLVAAQAALDRAGVDAADVLAVVDAAMEQALRTVSVERGVDPAGLALVAFGGAGPLHACALAEAMGIETVIIPARAGVLSAVGLLAAPPRREVVRSVADPTDPARIEAIAATLVEEARSQTRSEDARLEIRYDCRYAGQSHELTVSSVEAFHAEHAQRNGFAHHDAPVEVVAVRVTASGAPAIDIDDLPVPAHRAGVTTRFGPQVLAEPDCTIWLADGWRADLGASGALVLTPIAADGPEPVR